MIILHNLSLLCFFPVSASAIYLSLQSCDTQMAHNDHSFFPLLKCHFLKEVSQDQRVSMLYSFTHSQHFTKEPPSVCQILPYMQIYNMKCRSKLSDSKASLLSTVSQTSTHIHLIFILGQAPEKTPLGGLPVQRWIYEPGNQISRCTVLFMSSFLICLK